MTECTNVERITCIVDEDKTHNGEPLYRAIVEKAQESGIAGATVTKGIMGFGAAKRLRRERPMGRSSDVPVTIQMIDEKEKLDTFSETLCDMIQQGIIVREPVAMCHIRCGDDIL
ncbi:DUF190 domain-containing protein [Halodesulfovibrio marinisediminis]|uniref:Uncharacterized protein n=1 Tax=Halodesulfovibrio marinisediminis DSM 17456 TaxID=1121457 RepID=A0A1N6GNL9_9BACT|nr:DUF190 domain-containing protein [Halodesulfovibrio marinisediminis]SIO09136.1 hypothetical protein SAMN02745161_1708 [Halodesulfovibrio marinisediminis DSM 17456]